jgi:hypothetical protein
VTSEFVSLRILYPYCLCMIRWTTRSLASDLTYDRWPALQPIFTFQKKRKKELTEELTQQPRRVSAFSAGLCIILHIQSMDGLGRDASGVLETGTTLSISFAKKIQKDLLRCNTNKWSIYNRFIIWLKV